MSNLRVRAMRSAAWVTGGFVALQLIRLLNNLVLSRLLAPADFGVVAMVMTFIVGLGMFSDIGIGPNIVQNPRSSERGFLDTAWTVQIVRAAVIWLICAAAAWPMAEFYGAPELRLLLPGAALAMLAAGANSTKLYVAERDMTVGRITLIDLVAHLLGLLVMVLLAARWPSPWVLVIGAWTSASSKMLASHLLLPGTNNRLRWQHQDVRELVHFGQWILLSSLLSFGTNSTAALVLGKFVPMGTVGLFVLASTLAKAVEQAFQQIAQRVLFPLYTSLRSRPIEEFRRQIWRVRLAVMAVFLPALWILVCAAGAVVGLLFDARYADAGWMLRLAAMGVIPQIVSGVGPFYLAGGNSKLMMQVSALKFVIYVAALATGWLLAGGIGLIVAMCCHNLGAYVVEAIVQSRHGIWLPRLDALGFGSSMLVVGGFWYLFGWR